MTEHTSPQTSDPNGVTLFWSTENQCWIKTGDPAAEARARAVELRCCSGAFRTVEDRGAAMVAMTNAADHLDRLAEIIARARKALT